MKMENQTKRIALLIAVATMGAAQGYTGTSSGDTKRSQSPAKVVQKGNGQVAVHHVVSGQTKPPAKVVQKGTGQVASSVITSGQTKAPAYTAVTSGQTKAPFASVTYGGRRRFASEQPAKDYLHQATKMRNKELVKTLLGKGMDINKKDRRGRIALHYAVQSPMHFKHGHGSEKQKKDHLEFVKFLLGQGADVNAQDNINEMPLHLAEEKDVILLLLAEGADINAKGEHGFTKLDRAFSRGNVKLINLLIENGARLDIDAKDEYGFTKLDRAFSRSDARTADLLLKKGASLDLDKAVAQK